MRIAVSGAGLGGLTLALALHARGLQAVLCEREAVLGEAGAGVQLGPNAVKVLDALGVGEALRAVAFRPNAVEIREAPSGRLLLRTPLGEAAERRWGAPYLQLHRADLQRVLLDAVRARGAAELRLGAGVVSGDAAGRLHLDDGAVLAADAVVAADGLRSPLAAALHGPEAPRFTGQVAWRALVPRTEVGGLAPTASVWVGRGRHLVAYPLRGGREINLVAVTAERAWREEGWTAPGDPAELRRAFAGWPAPVPQLLAAVCETFRWALFDRPPRPRWSTRRATLLGDAAHPMLPFLAQGAAMAIEDAWVLAAELAGGADVEAALKAYERARRPRTAKVQAWSRRNAVLFHLPPPLARLAFAAAERGPGAGPARFDWLYEWNT